MRKTILLTLLVFSFSLFNRAQAQTVIANYIADHAEQAQELMHEYQVPASIILGVAIHESAAGTSKIARYLNNHFGFKGRNSSTKIKSAYRDFPDVDSSYNYFVEVLKNRTKFAVLFDKYDQDDYVNWARGIQRGGYAASRTWASQVIDIIKKYHLYEFDEMAQDNNEPLLAEVETDDFYIVKKGDNLNAIAEKNDTTAHDLMEKNDLESATLQPGQKIKL